MSDKIASTEQRLPAPNEAPPDQLTEKYGQVHDNGYNEQEGSNNEDGRSPTGFANVERQCLNKGDDAAKGNETRAHDATGPDRRPVKAG